MPVNNPQNLIKTETEQSGNSCTLPLLDVRRSTGAAPGALELLELHALWSKRWGAVAECIRQQRGVHMERRSPRDQARRSSSLALARPSWASHGEVLFSATQPWLLRAELCLLRAIEGVLDVVCICNTAG